MMYAAAIIAMLVTLALALVRALMGPTVFDRIAAINMFGTKTVLMIAVFAFMTDRHDLLDMALVYAMVNFISVIAVLRLFSHKDFFSPTRDDVVRLRKKS